VAVALVVAANVLVVVSAARERAGPASRATVAVCARHVVGGGDSEEPPALLLRTATDQAAVPAGLDSAGLRALGFSAEAAAAVGGERVPDMRWPRPRPAWARLHQAGDSLARFTVVAVAPRRELLAPDSTSILVRGRVSLLPGRVEPGADAGTAAGGHQHGPQAPAGGAVHAAVVEVLPSALHLDRGQAAALRRALGGSGGCAVRGEVVIANGTRGGIWVEAVR
jgi:hypothetical protein